MVDRHKYHYRILASQGRFSTSLCGRRSAKFAVRDSRLVTCRDCLRLLTLVTLPEAEPSPRD